MIGADWSASGSLAMSAIARKSVGVDSSFILTRMCANEIASAQSRDAKQASRLRSSLKFGINELRIYEIQQQHSQHYYRQGLCSKELSQR